MWNSGVATCVSLGDITAACVLSTQPHTLYTVVWSLPAKPTDASQTPPLRLQTIACYRLQCFLLYSQSFLLLQRHNGLIIENKT